MGVTAFRVRVPDAPPLFHVNTGLAESADATDSKFVDLDRKGSSPLSSTNLRVPGSPRSELPKEQYEKHCAPPPNFGYVSQSMKNLLLYGGVV